MSKLKQKYTKKQIARACSLKGSDRIAGYKLPLSSYLSGDPKDDPRGPKEKRSVEGRGGEVSLSDEAIEEINESLTQSNA